MSKSKGNVVTPVGLLEQHGADAVRYWAASSRLGVDAAFDPQNPTQIKIGRRLAIKILNASKFTLGFDASRAGTVSEPIDRSMLAALARVVELATQAFESYDHARALEVTETSFWTFCDDYLELVKERAHGEPTDAQASAVTALRAALSVYLRLFAPFVPYATEESWSWFNTDSVHAASWPKVDELTELSGTDADPKILDLVGAALIGIRGAKTEAKASQKTAVKTAIISATDEDRVLIEQAADDLQAVGRIAELKFGDNGADGVTVSHIELVAEEA